MVIVDDYNKYTWVKFLHKKSDAFEQFKFFKNMIELQTHHSIRKIRSNRGEKLLSSQFIQLWNEVGIQQQLANMDPPEQNGVVEQTNRKLLELERSMLVYAL